MLVITNPSTLAAGQHVRQRASARRACAHRSSRPAPSPGRSGRRRREIQTFIRARLTAADCIHPSYVTIMGDDELVPTFPGIGGIESDLEYSLRDSADEMPTSRSAGSSATTPRRSAPRSTRSSPTRTRRPAATGCARRPSPRSSRTTRPRTERGPDVHPVRRDCAQRASSPRRAASGCPSTASTRRTRRGRRPARVPRRHRAAGRAEEADVRLGRRHGRHRRGVERGPLPDGPPRPRVDPGWDNPRFASEDADALTNGAELPVVLSINCSSGAFQDDDRSFATQALVNPNGGAAGVFGDTEVSPTDHNTQIALGLPRRAAAAGAGRRGAGDQAARGRRADPRQEAAGRHRPPRPTASTRNELYLWHYFGDPSMQMWGGDPVELPDPRRFRAVFHKDFGPPRPDPPPYGVEVTLPAEFNGQAFSLLRNGEVIGKAASRAARRRSPPSSATPSPARRTAGRDGGRRRDADLDPGGRAAGQDER